GDFAYDMDQGNARVGDAFMRKIEPVAASVPYMTCPGNHEEKYNFSNYRARFSMPGNTEGLWYSWDIGPAHIISFSTEVYFWVLGLLGCATDSVFLAPSWDIGPAHIISFSTEVYFYDDCTEHESIIRRGLQHQYGLEDLFYKYGVDLELWAHEHSYERLWPVYNYQVYNGSASSPYTNPRAPVHIITGSAGCKERLDPFVPRPREWSALRIEDYGYTRLHVANRSHIWLEQVSDDQDGKVVDGVWVIKNLHGPEAWH
uniref:Acid phosphatase 7, tartrate resistant (putative) n=1 Tax=Pelodiscus sinensis TaxID=13735 RepID=K7GAV7_PELSI